MTKIILAVLLLAVLQAAYSSPVKQNWIIPFEEELHGNVPSEDGSELINNNDGKNKDSNKEKESKHEINNNDKNAIMVLDVNEEMNAENPELAGGENIVEGDIQLTPLQAAIYNKSGWEGLVKSEAWNTTVHKLWPREIPYVIDNSVEANVLGAITRAIYSFFFNTCLRIIPRTTETDYIRFVKSNGCSSDIGRQGGVQNIRLAFRCVDGTPVHEIMHALGRYHEHSRPDRDNYVNILMNNIDPNEISNFEIVHADTQGIPYDYGSLMHYSEKAFSINNRNTIETKPIRVNIGQRRRMSVLDKLQINVRYCPERVVRLVGGNSGIGRVEMSWNGQWGTVCDRGFNKTDGKVICKYIGFPDVVDVHGGAHYGQGSGPIHFSNMECQGNERTPYHCNKTIGPINNCAHSQDVGVSCEANIRLVDGTTTSGRVEVYVEGQWGTICNDAFDDKDAKVICRQLGLPYANARPIHVQNVGNLPKVISGLKCKGFEDQIIHCCRNTKRQNCQHQEAAVECR